LWRELEELASCDEVVRIEPFFEPRIDARRQLTSLVRLAVGTEACKVFVGDAAVRIVDRALALSGAAGYLNGSPPARAYRDVRALPFMHPLGANRAYAFLGQLAAGREPSLH
jgi:alkylation response protein AidB-like acyl-CoA dehydrogenase